MRLAGVDGAPDLSEWCGLVSSLGPEELESLDKVVVALSAEAGLPSQTVADSIDEAVIAEGRALMSSASLDCTRCHTFRERTEGDEGPVLTRWASRDWTMGLLRDPAHESFYGDGNDRMPSFGPEGLLNETELGLIVDWLRRDWYEPTGAR